MCLFGCVVLPAGWHCELSERTYAGPVLSNSCCQFLCPCRSSRLTLDGKTRPEHAVRMVAGGLRVGVENALITLFLFFLCYYFILVEEPEMWSVMTNDHKGPYGIRPNPFSSGWSFYVFQRHLCRYIAENDVASFGVGHLLCSICPILFYFALFSLSTFFLFCSSCAIERSTFRVAIDAK